MKETLYSKRMIILLLIVFMFAPKIKLNACGFKSNTVYTLHLKGTLVDYKEKDTFADMIPALIGLPPNPKIGLNHILKNIKTAAENPKVVGIYLYGGELKGGYASLKEIRDALLEFKKSGKFILAFSEKYSQSNYYLVSVADRIMLNPTGSVDIKGLASMNRFYKNAIDKIGIEMQVVKVGTYKSAVEPYTNTSMSEPNREQVSIFLNSIWRNISTEMSDARNIDLDSLNRMADRFTALQSDEFYLHNNLVDTLVYVDQTDSILDKYIVNDKKAKKLSHNAFTAKNKKSPRNRNKIAVIYADGTIMENGSINAKTMRALCKSLEENEAVKAVVLRVNSPGGSAFESENIWRALSQLKAKKPLVVSMGNYAASGGYYMACMANVIVAEPTTITGSIGIFGLFPNLKGVNDKIGLTYDGVKTNKMSDAYSLNRAFNDDERDLMQGNVDRGYELFVKRCAEGRNKSIEDIKAIAEGRVWTGENALEIGLVDTLGGIHTAIEIAAQLAKTPEYQTMKVNYEKRKHRVSLVKVKQRLEEEILKSNLGNYYQLLNELNNIHTQDPIQARMQYRLND